MGGQMNSWNLNYQRNKSVGDLKRKYKTYYFSSLAEGNSFLKRMAWSVELVENE